MGALTDGALLDAWLIGESCHPLDRSLILLDAAFPSESPEQLAQLSLGECNQRLAALREAMFGPRWHVVADCAACGAPLEFTLTALGAALSDDRQSTGIPGEPRPLNIIDLAAVAALADPRTARRELARRVLGLTEQEAATLGDDEIAAAASRLAELDPNAELLIELDCPDCGHHWSAPFDVPAFVWSDVDRAARALLLDIVTLARAFGWSETDILRMGRRKRQLYREMASS